MTTQARIKELLAAGRSAQETLLAEETRVRRMLPEVVPLPLLYGYGWYRACSRLTRACSLLLEAGLDHEGAALRRSLLEHTSALVWLARSGDAAVRALDRRHQGELKRFVGSLTGPGWPEVPAAVQEFLALPLPPSSEEVLAQMTHRLAAFGMQTFLAPWLLDTGVAHPSTASARHFWQDHPDGSVSFPDQADAGDGLPTVTGNAVLLMLATLALDELLGGGTDLQAAARRAGEAIGLAADLPVRAR